MRFSPCSSSGVYRPSSRTTTNRERCFDIGVLVAPPVRMYPTAANGYYAMLRPLPPGTHTIDLGGILPSMAQAITYTLIVE